MKKPILLLQFRTDQSLQHELDCILEKGQFKPNEVEVRNIFDNNFDIPTPEDLDKYSAVIAGGSGQFNISDWPDEIKTRVELLKPFVLEIVKKDFPALFICFGHQLLAYFLGSSVEADEKQSEVGTFKVSLTNEGRRSFLFNDIPNKFWVVMGHKDSVMKLPESATNLAYSERCGIQSLRFGNNVYSTQFHAELDREGLVFRLSLYPSYMKGKSIEKVMKQFHPIPHATKIIKNWRHIVNK